MICNVNICAYNKNGQCTKENAKIELNYDYGLTAYCSDFQRSKKYISEQYGIQKYSETEIVILVKDTTVNILVDKEIIKELIYDKFGKQFNTVYFDNILFVGTNATNRILEYSNDIFKIADKKIAKEIKNFVHDKYPNIKKYWRE
jgi:hypothetical protein